MASVFKPKGKAKYIIFYTDETGRRRKKVGATDKSVTQRIARDLENRVALRREGLIDPAAESYAAHGGRILADHLADFHAGLVQKEDAPRYVQQVRANVARILETGGMCRPSDLSPARVQEALARLRAAGLSLQTL